MDQRFVVGDDMDTLLDQAVLDVDDGLFIAGNGAGRKHHRVTGSERHIAHLVTREFGKGGTRFTLRTGQDQHHLVARNIAIFVFGEEWLDAFHDAEVLRDVDDALQRRAKQQHLTPRGLCGLRNRADTPDIGGEGGNGHSAFSILNDLPQAFGNLVFGGRNAITDGVGTVAHQRQNTLFTDGAEAGFIRQRTERRRFIDFPVAGMDDVAERCADDQRHRLRDGVVDADSFDFERTDIDAVASLKGRDRNFGAAALIGALGFQHTGGETRGIDRHVEARPQIVQRAVMVLMGVGDDDAFEVFLLFGDIGDVGQHQIDARQIETGKGHAAIHHDPFTLACRTVAVKRQIHADFTDAAKRQEDQFVLFSHCFSYPFASARGRRHFAAPRACLQHRAC